MEKHVLLSVLIMVVFINLNYVASEMPAAMKECKTKEGVTDEDLKTLKNQDQPKSPAMKCFVTCLGEKSGQIVNNKLNNDAILKSIKTLPNYSQQLEQSVNEVLAECKSIADPDRCNFGSKAMTCLKDGAMKRGLKGVFMPNERT